MTGPLSGYRIIDMTSVVSGPLCTMMLGDQGADVIKIENPDGGDFTRAMSNRRGGLSAPFINNNRSKRSVAVNTKTKIGLEIVKKLAADADVFIQNMRPGVIKRIGLDEEVIREINKGIIYVSISGFGENGPFAERPVYDPLVQALSGLTTIQAGSDDERPRLVRTIVPDKLTGVMAAQAITAALLERERSGEGQHVRLSMLDSVISFLWHSDMGSQTFVGGEFPQEAAQSFIDLIYETLDGYISVAVNTDKQWLNLANALGHPEWLTDERFKTPALRHKNINDRLEITQEVLKEKKSGEWLELLTQLDVPCAPVLTRKEAIKHSQVISNRSIKEINHSKAGKIRQCVPSPRFSRFPMKFIKEAPGLGVDTEKILIDFGISKQTIKSLLQRDIISSLKV